MTKAVTTLSKDAVFLLGAVDLSAFINNVSFGKSADSLDVSTYTNDSHRKTGGLFDGTISVDGVYGTTATGPRDTIGPLIGTVTTFTWRPEGTGAGLPEETGSVLVQAYNETAPVAEVVSWTANLERDGDWTAANQI
jgi:hypothetical protein